MAWTNERVEELKNLSEKEIVSTRMDKYAQMGVYKE